MGLGFEMHMCRYRMEDSGGYDAVFFEWCGRCVEMKGWWRLPWGSQLSGDLDGIELVAI